MGFQPHVGKGVDTMVSRLTVLSALLIAGLVAAKTANASTLIAPGGSYTFKAANNTFHSDDQPPFGSGSPFPFIHDYTFTVSGGNTDADLAAISVQGLSGAGSQGNKPYITDLVVKWIGGPST